MDEEDYGPRFAIVLNGETVIRRESSSLAFEELERLFNTGGFLVLSIMNIRKMNEGRKAMEDEKCNGGRASGPDRKRVGVVVRTGAI